MNGNLLPTDAEQQVRLDLIIYTDELSHETSGEQGLYSENDYSIQSIDERANKSSTILEGILRGVRSGDARNQRESGLTSGEFRYESARFLSP